MTSGSPRGVDESLAKGLRALSGPGGSELLVAYDPSIVSLDENPERTSRVDSPFASAFILAAVSGRLASRAAAVAPPHVGRLLATREGSGLWRFAQEWSWPVPPDADDSACALAALRLWNVQGVDLQATLDRLLTNRDAAGRLRTWFFAADEPGRRELEHEVDAAVNANILYAAALLGRELPEDAAFVARTVLDQGLAEGCRSYYPNPLVFCYFLARWLQLAGGFPELRSAVARFCLDRCEACRDALDGALLITCLRRLAPSRPAPLPALAGVLLGAQRSDGLWPALAFCGDPRGKVYGSAQVTTALCVEALGELAVG